MTTGPLDGDPEDHDHWCLFCGRWIYWQAVAQRWVHVTSHVVRCRPLDPTIPAAATPAPGGALRRAPGLLTDDGVRRSADHRGWSWMSGSS